MVLENDQGAYLGPGPGLAARAALITSNPHFDVFDWDEQRLILAKCSRLPDDEDPVQGRYGIDFHRALPPFVGTLGVTCDWGDGPVTVNAYNYARYLPQTLQFREFTATLAFAAWTWEEYQAKRRVYEEFYQYLYDSPTPIILALPHSGEVRRLPDDYHPFPQCETDAWTARVAVCCAGALLPSRKRILISLHSTDYFGALLEVGDFGLPQNALLPQVIEHLRARFADAVAALWPAYCDYIVPYTQARVSWIEQHWGTLDPQQLAAVSTAARFEILSLTRVLADCLDPRERFTAARLQHGLDHYRTRPTADAVTLNSIFSGRKTARLLNLADNLQKAGIDTAVQVECSRFLARYYPDLTAALITALIEGLESRV